MLSLISHSLADGKRGQGKVDHSRRGEILNQKGGYPEGFSEI
jgi:hypothetical protein